MMGKDDGMFDQNVRRGLSSSVPSDGPQSIESPEAGSSSEGRRGGVGDRRPDRSSPRTITITKRCRRNDIN